MLWLLLLLIIIATTKIDEIHFRQNFECASFFTDEAITAFRAPI